MEYLTYFEGIDSNKLVQSEQLKAVKEIFETDEWKRYRDATAEDLERRHALNKALRRTRGEISDSIDMLWKDTLISFAREIHNDKRVRDLDEEKIVEIEKHRAMEKKRQFQKGMLKVLIPISMVSVGIPLIGMWHSVQFLIGTLLFSIGAVAGLLNIGDGFREISKSRRDDYDWAPIPELRKIAELMVFVRKTEPYKAILELEDFREIISNEIDQVSWPPVNWRRENVTV